MIAIATPVSHLFRDPNVAAQLTAESDALEFRDHHSPDVETQGPVLYHAEQSIVHPMDVPALLGAVERWMPRDQLALVSLHVPSCFDEPVVQDGAFQPGGRRIPVHELMTNACRNAELLRRSLPASVTLAIENNNYFATGAYEDVTDAAFLSRLVTETGVEFLLDLGHARITAHHMGIGFDDYMSELPLSRAVQIHLSGYDAGQPTWRDAHAELRDEQWAEAEAWIRRLPRLRFTTLEYYRDSGVLSKMIARLRAMLRPLNAIRL